MADSKILQPFILSWEGGFGNHPQDPGGATMKGVTLATFQSVYGKNKTVQDLKNITDEQWHHIFKTLFWDKCKVDQIGSQSIANLIVDWAYNSGTGTAIKKVQKIVGTSVDGIVGPKTLEAINKRDRLSLFNEIYIARENFFKSLKTFPTFGKGWMRRLRSIGFGWLVLNTNPSKTITFHDER